MSRRRWHWVFGAAGLVGAGLVTAVTVWVLRGAGPAVGTVHQAAATGASRPGGGANQPNRPASPQTITGTYISVSYPQTYRRLNQPVTGNYLEVFDLHGTDHTAKDLAIGVRRGSLAEDSGVKLRRLQADQYQEAPLRLADATGIVFTKRASDFEQTAFVAHGDLVASISLTDPNPADLTGEFSDIVKSLHWR